MDYLDAMIKAEREEMEKWSLEGNVGTGVCRIWRGGQLTEECKGEVGEIHDKYRRIMKRAGMEAAFEAAFWADRVVDKQQRKAGPRGLEALLEAARGGVSDKDDTGRKLKEWLARPEEEPNKVDYLAINKMFS